VTVWGLWMMVCFWRLFVGEKGACVPFIARRPPLRQDHRMRPWNGPKRLKPKRKIKRKIQFRNKIQFSFFFFLKRRRRAKHCTIMI